jgi:RNA polymerase sigma-70 factor (ECF subfamily)
MMLNRDSLQKLHRYAYSLTANEADAYDLLQSAIESSLNHPSDSEMKTMSYLRVIIKNRYIDEYRHKQKFPLEDIDDHSPVSLNESSLEDVVIASHDLKNLWPTLEAIDREVLYFWAVEGFSMGEIADKMSISRGTLLSRIHRLRKRLMVERESMQGGLA